MNTNPPFGSWLKQRRRELDLTQEALAEQVGCSVQMVRKIEAGTARPSRQLAELLATGLQVPPAEQAAFVNWARASLREQSTPVQSPISGDGAQPTRENPYKGLRPFRESDADDFFGREALTDHLLARLGDTVELGRFLAVVGPSGSGKSSVVRAGVIPALRRGALHQSDRWPVLDITPGPHPLEELEAALLRVAVNPPATLMEQLRQDERGLLRAVKRVLPTDPATEMVLLIDQFEEVFTHVEDEAVRRHLLDNLYVAVSDPRSPLRVVATLRADFYDRPLLYPRPGELLRQRTELVLPMKADELERAIVRPAKRVGVGLEPDLLAAIIQDVGEEPGMLPLLQYTLTELFDRREGRLMTLRAYQATGGVMGAISRRAEEIYCGLSEIEQEVARQLFLRLVTLGEGVEDTRRRAKRSELASATPNEEALEKVLEIFGRYRLLTFDRDRVSGAPTVEVAHEALLRSWRRLRAWLEASRESLRVQRRLLAASHEWTGAGKDPSFLAPGARLVQFEALAAEGDLALNAEERAYLEASVAERERQEEAERERQARELALQKRAANRLRYLVVALMLFLVVAGALAMWALNQSQEAQANLVLSDAQRMAGEASLRLQSGPLDELIPLLSVRSVRTQYTPQGDAALTAAATMDYPRQRYVGHSDQINSIAFSPDGKRLLTGSFDGTARLWDVARGKEIQQFKGHAGRVFSAGYSPDGKYVLTGSADNTARLWDADTGAELRTFSAPSVQLTSLSYSPDGKRVLAGGRDGKVTLWDTETGSEVQQFAGHTDRIFGVAYSPDGKYVLTSSADGTTRFWDVNTGQELRQLIGHKDIFRVAYSSDGKYVLTGGGDSTARLWDAATGAEVRRFAGHTDLVSGVAITSDGKYVLTGSWDGTARLWDGGTGQELRQLKGHNQLVAAVAFSPDGNYLATGSQDPAALLWETQPPARPPQFKGHDGGVWSVAYSSDGKYVLTGGDDHAVRLWDASTGRELRQLDTQFLGECRACITFAHDSKHALTAASDGTLRLWDVSMGEQLSQFKAHEESVTALALSPDGKYVLTNGNGGAALLWDAKAGKELREFSGHAGVVSIVAYSPDGKQVITGSDDRTARLWDAHTGEELRQFTGHDGPVLSIAFSPDGRYALTGSVDKTARLWDAHTGKEALRFTNHKDVVGAVAFSPDGRYALTGSDDKTARLWDVGSGKEVRRFTGHSDWVNSVAFSPDGRYVLTGSQDGTARLWYTDINDTIRYLCEPLLRDFTSEERAQYGIRDKDPTCRPEASRLPR